MDLDKKFMFEREDEMTNEEKKEYLHSYLDMEAEIARLEEERTRWRSKAEQTTAAMCDAPEGGRGRASLQSAVEEIDRVEAELGKKLCSAIEKKKNIERAIDSVRHERLRRLLRYKYMSDMTWEDIAEHMGLSVRQTYRLHERVISEMSLYVMLEV